jgi:pimeloyl-ACP methyl ester carboxylesterase
MDARERTVPVSSTRVVRLTAAGDPRGVPVFTLHGTPGARLIYPPLAEAAASMGIRLLGTDRAGYGGSTRNPGRSIGDEAADVRAVADALRIDRFGVWGFSGGGAPALACAARLPDRVVATASLAGVAPYGVPGLDWTAGMGELNVEDFRLLERDPEAFHRKCWTDRDEMLGWDPDQIREGWASLLSPRDRSFLTEEYAGYLHAAIRAGLGPGADGMFDDNLSCVRPWGFEPTELVGPVQVWQGREDRFVPYAHGAWLAAHVPGAEAHLLDDEGHLSLFQRKVPEAMRWIADRF